jgi:diguanylate cyclase (GGDEF)-like protein
MGLNTPYLWVIPGERDRFVAELVRAGRVDDLEVQLRSSRGAVFWIRMSAQRLRFDGEDTLLGAMIDVTEQKRAQERLRELATVDALTGVYNRRYLEEIVGRELERAHRYRRPLTIAMLDADHFKRINDTRGHVVGDSVLRVMAERCGDGLRANDVIGRYGGEEFLVVFPETGLDEARAVAERLRVAIAKDPIGTGADALRLTVSIGLATLGPGEDARGLLARADSALYAAKQGGRNRVTAATTPVPFAD